jgi:hypothetical protein
MLKATLQTVTYNIINLAAVTTVLLIFSRRYNCHTGRVGGSNRSGKAETRLRRMFECRMCYNAKVQSPTKVAWTSC